MPANPDNPRLTKTGPKEMNAFIADLQSLVDKAAGIRDAIKLTPKGFVLADNRTGADAAIKKINKFLNNCQTKVEEQ